MPSINQLLYKQSRQKKFKKNKTPALAKKPQVKGICVKVFTRSPKKPNSALRKESFLDSAERTLLGLLELPPPPPRPPHLDTNPKMEYTLSLGSVALHLRSSSSQYTIDNFGSLLLFAAFMDTSLLDTRSSCLSSERMRLTRRQHLF